MIYLPFLLSCLGMLLSLLLDVYKMSYIQVLISACIFVAGGYIFYIGNYSPHLYGLLFTDPLNSFATNCFLP